MITGAGRGFCVGQDLREHQELLAAEDPSPLHTVVEHYNPIVTALVEMPKPVIAAVNGMAAGAGAGIAFAADFRIASQSAGFLIAFANVGLSLDTGTSWTLRAACRLRARQPSRSSPIRSSAECGAGDGAGQCGRRAGPGACGCHRDRGPARLPDRRRRMPRSRPPLRYGATSTLAEALANEAELQLLTGATEDHRIGVAAFVAKQKPSFIGR